MRIVLLIIFLFSGVVYAQTTNLKFKNYSIEDGLSQSTVYAILEDEMGYLWIGTRDGLNRFDNDQFVTFYPASEDPQSLSYRSVRALARDANGFIWVGTDGGGVDRLDPLTNRFTNLCTIIRTEENCELKTNVTSLEIDEGKLYIGTRRQGLFIYDISSGAVERKAHNSSTIWDMEVVGSRVFLGTSEGMLIWDPQTQTERVFKQEEEIRSIKKENDGRILFGSRNGGVYELYINQNEVQPFCSLLNETEISSLAFDDKGNVWIGTDEQGIYVLDKEGEVISHLDESNRSIHELPSNSIRTLYKDSNGIIWAGTNNAGLANYFDGRYQFRSYSSENTNGALSGNVVLSFNQLDTGELLVGTERYGLFVFDKEQKSFFPVNAFNGENIIAVLKDEKGQIWVATDGSGLFMIPDQRSLNQVRHIEGLTDASVLSLMQSPAGELFAGTYKGLNILKDGIPMNLDFAPVYLQDDRILAMHALNDREYLLGTFSNGLVYFDKANKVFQRFYPFDEGSMSSQSPERVQAIYEDSKGRIWLGSYSGLALLNREQTSIKLYTTRDGLPSDVVYGILEDEDQNLWLSTNAGIVSFDPDQETYRTYGLLDGLPSREFNGGAFFRDEEGTMYFGGIAGFTEFTPDEIQDVSPGGAVIIHSMEVDDQSFNTLEQQEFELGARQDFLQFNFSYLNFVNPYKFELQYQMDGLSSSWVSIPTDTRSLNFSGLAPGDYRLNLRAVNEEGLALAESTPISFIIQPPLWMRWYFILLVAAVISLAVVVLFRYRMYYLLREEATRNRIARDLHDDISATLSSISFFSEAARRKQGDETKSAEYIELIEKSAIEAKEKINDIIWSIDPEQDDAQSLLTKCKRFAGEMLDSKQIAYRLDFDESLSISSGPEVRQDFWLIFKELINNLVRHSGAQNAVISFKRKGNVLELIVEDDGVGISKDNMHEGNGLRNLQYRAARLNGDLMHRSPEGGGTRWELLIPV